MIASEVVTLETRTASTVRSFIQKASAARPPGGLASSLHLAREGSQQLPDRKDERRKHADQCEGGLSPQVRVRVRTDQETGGHAPSEAPGQTQ